jgi:hypothetical protein
MLENFKINKKPDPDWKSFEFSYQEKDGTKRSYKVERTESKVSEYNMKAFWKQIKNLKGKVPNIWTDPNLREMHRKGYIRITNLLDPQLSLEFPEHVSNILRKVASILLR